MKTAAEWIDEHYGTLALADPALIAAIQADARAGMVDVCELVERTAERDHFRDACKEHFEREAKHKAELAKAWEAAIDAAALLVPKWIGDGHAVRAMQRAIRRLQPPGGKAK